MLPLLRSLVWGLLVFQSFGAMGRHLARALGSPHAREAALPAGWGLAAMAVLGGWLNAVGVARSSVLVGLVLVVVVIDLLRDWRAALGMVGSRRSPVNDAPKVARAGWETLWIVPLLMLVGLKYVTSLAISFNDFDDQPAYLAQAARMLQTGSVGVDPFSARQLMSLNGQTFLVGLLCSVAPLSHVFLLDPGVCWMVLAAQTWSIARRDLGGSPSDASLLAALVLMADVPFINASGYLASSVLFLTLIRTAYLAAGGEGKSNGSSLLLMALTTAGLCALKTTCIYYTGAFLAVLYGLRLRHSPRLAPVRESCLIVLIAAALLLPWMWQQYRSGGTPLYPLLGKGHHVSGPGLEIFSDSLTTRAKSGLFYLSHAPTVAAIVVLISLASCPFRGDPRRWRVLFASNLAATIGSLAFASYTVSNSVGRLTQGFMYAALIPAGLYGFLGPRASRANLGLAAGLALFVGGMWANMHVKLATVRDVVQAGRMPSLYPDGEDDRIRAAQSAIPAGRTVLVALQNAFLLDFSRNHVLNLDQLGMMSPPPGLPITADAVGLRDFLSRRTNRLPRPARGDDVLRYFRDAGIEYLMFQRGDKTAWFNGKTIAEKPYWSRLVGTFATLVLQEAIALIPRCETIYEDGDLVVLDLSAAKDAPRPIVRPSCREATVSSPR